MLFVGDTMQTMNGKMQFWKSGTDQQQQHNTKTGGINIMQNITYFLFVSLSYLKRKTCMKYSVT